MFTLTPVLMQRAFSQKDVPRKLANSQKRMLRTAQWGKLTCTSKRMAPAL
jgi:hypothetical protein